MPTSHSSQLNEIVQIADLLAPRSVLDVGLGNGKYGYLLREYLGVNRGLGRDEMVIDGIEGVSHYLNDVHRAIYNRIFLLDLTTDALPADVHYDLSIIIDVIEHFERDVGMGILDRVVAMSKVVLVTTPWDIGDPNLRHDHPFEDHKYQWRKSDFARYPAHQFVFNRDSLMVLIGRDQAALDAVARKMVGRFYKTLYEYFRRRWGLKRG
jgi:SAM-dependent methyltransferase